MTFSATSSLQSCHESLLQAHVLAELEAIVRKPDEQRAVQRSTAHTDQVEAKVGFSDAEIVVSEDCRFSWERRALNCAREFVSFDALGQARNERKYT